MPHLPAIVLFIACQVATPTVAPAVEPASSTSSSTFSLGARTGVEGSFIVLPMAGLSAGLTSRLRLNQLVSIEPHVDAAVDSFVLIGFMHGQVGVPIVFYHDSGQHAGVGPLLGHGTIVGHVDSSAPSITSVGGEGLVGFDWPVAPSLDVRVQARAWATSPVTTPLPLLGVMLTLGLMYGL